MSLSLLPEAKASPQRARAPQAVTVRPGLCSAGHELASGGETARPTVPLGREAEGSHSLTTCATRILRGKGALRSLYNAQSTGQV